MGLWFTESVERFGSAAARTTSQSLQPLIPQMMRLSGDGSAISLRRLISTIKSDPSFLENLCFQSVEAGIRQINTDQATDSPSRNVWDGEPHTSGPDTPFAYLKTLQSVYTFAEKDVSHKLSAILGFPFSARGDYTDRWSNPKENDEGARQRLLRQPDRTLTPEQIKSRRDPYSGRSRWPSGNYGEAFATPRQIASRLCAEVVTQIQDDYDRRAGVLKSDDSWLSSSQGANALDTDTPHAASSRLMAPSTAKHMSPRLYAQMHDPNSTLRQLIPLFDPTNRDGTDAYYALVAMLGEKAVVPTLEYLRQTQQIQPTMHGKNAANKGIYELGKACEDVFYSAREQGNSTRLTAARNVIQAACSMNIDPRTIRQCVMHLAKTASTDRTQNSGEYSSHGERGTRTRDVLSDAIGCVRGDEKIQPGNPDFWGKVALALIDIKNPYMFEGISPSDVRDAAQIMPTKRIADDDGSATVVAHFGRNTAAAIKVLGGFPTDEEIEKFRQLWRSRGKNEEEIAEREELRFNGDYAKNGITAAVKLIDKVAHVTEEDEYGYSKIVHTGNRLGVADGGWIAEHFPNIPSVQWTGVAKRLPRLGDFTRAIERVYRLKQGQPEFDHLMDKIIAAPNLVGVNLRDIDAFDAQIQSMVDSQAPASAHVTTTQLIDNRSKILATFKDQWPQWIAYFSETDTYNGTNQRGSDLKFFAALHDSAQMLPDDAAVKLRGLRETLWRHRASIRKDRRFALIAKTWAELTPDERKLPLPELYETAAIKAAPKGWTNKAFAIETSKHGATKDYAENEARWVKSQAVPLPKWATSFKPVTIGSYTGRFLIRDDTRGLYLGHYTGCCQHPEGAGGACAWHGQESPNGAFFVVEDKEKEIVCQSWVWADEKGSVCFDNVEAINIGKRMPFVRAIYEQAAAQLGANGAQFVTVGDGLGDMDLDGWQPHEPSLYPADYDDYRDSTNQFTLHPIAPENRLPSPLLGSRPNIEQTPDQANQAGPDRQIAFVPDAPIQQAH